MILAATLFFGLQGTTDPVERIKSVRVQFKKVSQNVEGIATVVAKSSRSPSRSFVLHLDACAGVGASSKPVILDNGRVAIFTRHELSRVNSIVALTVENGKINIDQEYNETLYKLLPKELASSCNLVMNNVQITGASAGQVAVNFVNRDEKDGVKATFRVKNLKWTCAGAKYWREKDWDGIRRF